MTRLVLAFAMLISFSFTAMAQGPPPPPGLCSSTSPFISANGNGSFTAASAQAYFWEIESGNATIGFGGTSQTVQINCITAYELKVTRFIGGSCYEDCISVPCTSNPCQYSINMEKPMCYNANTICRARSGRFTLSNPCFSSLTADWEVISSGGCAVTTCLTSPPARINSLVFRPSTTCDIAGQTVTINAYQPNTNNLWATTTVLVGWCDLIIGSNGKTAGPDSGPEQYEVPRQGQLKTIATDLLTGQQILLHDIPVEQGERINLENEMKKLENGHLYDIRIMLDGELINSRKVRMD